MECEFMVIYFLPGPIILFISWILQVVSISTSHWSSDSVSNAGLWEICRGLSPADLDRVCFKFSERDHLPLMPFICSALGTLGVIVLTGTTVWSLSSLLQSTSRASRWQRKSGMLSLAAVVFIVFSVCLYGASYNDISYNMIPKWSGKYDMKLSWSYTVSCIAGGTSLVGATLCITLSLKVKEISSLPPGPAISPSHIPALQIHPPPSSRLSTPSRFSHARAASPLPFTYGRFASSKFPKRMTPVHVT